jgi:UDP-glucose 4-epimerase
MPPETTSTATVRRPERGRVVAVSGAASFLGTSLVGLLEEDRTVSRVVAVDVTRPSRAGLKTRFYEVDLTEPAADSRLSEILGAERVDTFVHLAFLSSPTHATAWAHELESVGTMHVLGACRAHPVRKLVVRSWTLLYGPHPQNPNFLTEGHALRGLRGSPWVSDKLEVEREVVRFADRHPECVVTVLRLAPLMGPNVKSFVTRWLGRRLVPTVMGYDPLLQFLHELDAIAALKLVVDHEAAGVWNIVGAGVLPVSTVVKLAGRTAVPVPRFLARQSSAFLWAAHLNEAPPELLDYLQFLCVADGSRARDELGYRPAFTSREAVLDFEGTVRLREARLLRDTAGARPG